MNASEKFESRSIIEALRTGVPSEALVRRLVPSAPAIWAKFDELLPSVASGGSKGSTGLIFQGDFGSGKSHLLEQLAYDAEASGFVVSRAKVSKDLPLSKESEFLVQVVQGTRVAGIRDDAVAQVLTRALENEQLEPVLAWARREANGGRLAEGFYATLRAFIALGPRSQHSETIVNYWSGAAMAVGEIRGALRAGSPMDSQAALVRAGDRPVQTLRFLSHIFQHLGHRGWIVILDEVELLRTLGPVARAKSYAWLSIWLGLDPKSRVPGLGAIAGVTPDLAWEFVDSANHSGRRDESLLPPKLFVSAANQHYLEDCKRGMAAIKSIDLAMDKKSPEQLASLQAKIRAEYLTAFGSRAKPIPIAFDPNKSVRAYIRGWITAWDLQRLRRADDLDFELVRPNVEPGDDDE